MWFLDWVCYVCSHLGMGQALGFVPQNRTAEPWNGLALDRAWYWYTMDGPTSLVLYLYWNVDPIGVWSWHVMPMSSLWHGRNLSQMISEKFQINLNQAVTQMWCVSKVSQRLDHHCKSTWQGITAWLCFTRRFLLAPTAKKTWDELPTWVYIIHIMYTEYLCIFYIILCFDYGL